MKVNLNENKLRKAEIEAFRNGLRLHLDAIKLFANKSYPSAYSLSVLALEEFGKQRLIDDIIFHYIEHKNEFENDKQFSDFCNDFEKGLLSHSLKQGFAISDDFPFMRGYNRMQKGYLYKMFNHKKKRKLIDDWKMRSIYVGFENNSLKGRIQTPAGFIKRKKAQDQITAINDYLINFIIYIRQGRWTLDNENLMRLFDINLLNKLTNTWKYRHKDTQKRLSCFMASKNKPLVS
jgi:AbiV family abortive infection protein